MPNKDVQNRQIIQPNLLQLCRTYVYEHLCMLDATLVSVETTYQIPSVITYL